LRDIEGAASMARKGKEHSLNLERGGRFALSRKKTPCFLLGGRGKGKGSLKEEEKG